MEIRNHNNYLLYKDGRIYSKFTKKFLEIRNKMKGGIIKLLKDNGDAKNRDDWIEHNVKELIQKYYYKGKREDKEIGDEFILYYNDGKGLFHTLNSKTREYKKVECIKEIKCDYKYDISRVYTVYVNENGECKRFIELLDRFNKECDELAYNGILSIRVKKYYTLKWFIVNTLKRLCPLFKQLETERIDDIEAFVLSELGHNGGLSYCKKGYYECYGKDMIRAYPRLMASEEFKIPKTSGQQKIILNTPQQKEDLKFGKYRMDITCKDKRFYKIFAQKDKKYDENKWYSYYDILTCLKYKDDFGIEMKMVDDGLCNAYIYKNKDLITGREMFGQWFDVLFKISQKYPDNKLMKIVMSQAHGFIAQKERYTISMEEANKRNDIGVDKKYMIDNIVSIFHDNKAVELVRTDGCFYNYNIRIQYLSAYVRYVIANDIMKNNLLDNVIRIYSDNITLNKNIFINENYKDEDKTTGFIIWRNSQTYFNISEFIKMTIYDNDLLRQLEKSEIAFEKEDNFISCY